MAGGQGAAVVEGAVDFDAVETGGVGEGNDMSTNQETTNPSAAAPTPEAVVDQLRAVQIGEVTPLTPTERRKLRRRTINSNPILQASINVLGALENVSQTVGQPADQARQLYDEANRRTAVEDELRKMLSGSPERTSSAASASRSSPPRRTTSDRNWPATPPTPSSYRTCRRSGD